MAKKKFLKDSNEQIWPITRADCIYTIDGNSLLSDDYSSKNNLEDAKTEMKEYVDNSIPETLPANGGNADTVQGYSVWVGTQAEYDALTSRDSSTIYFIKG